MFSEVSSFSCFGVVPVLVGPLQVILTILPGILLAMLGGIFRLFSPSGFRNAVRLAWQQKTAVVILALLIAGAVYGFRTLLADRGTITEAETGSDWTTARFDLRRTGAVPFSKSPTVAKVVWNFRSEYGYFASPAVVGNRVYISAVQLGSFEKSGQIFCLDADTGGVVWANSPKNYRPTFSSPVIAGDYLVCGEGLHETRDARVICLDIRSEKKGEVLWTFETKNHVECTPAVYNGRVYVGAGDDGIYCLDLKLGQVVWHIPNTMYVGSDGKQFKDKTEDYGLRNDRFKAGVAVGFKTEMKDGKNVATVLRLLAKGENASQFGDLSGGIIQQKDVAKGVLTVATAKGQELELTVSEFADAETSLAVHDGKVYFGLGNDGKALSVIDAETGKELQRVAMPHPVFGPPSIARSKLYLGMGEGDYVTAGPEGPDGGEVRCLDLATLKTEWSYGKNEGLKKTVLGAVAIMEEIHKNKTEECKLYFGSCDGAVYCLSEKGELLGKYQIPGKSAIKTSPAVTDKWVYIVTDRGLLIALDRKSLTPRWEYRLGPPQFFISSPVVARGHVYVGTEKDGFFCIGEPETLPYWPNPLGGLNRTGNDDDSFFPEEMAVHWSYSAGADKTVKVKVPASIACWKESLDSPEDEKQLLSASLYVPIAWGETTGLACLPRNTPTGSKPQPRWFYPTNREISQSPVVLGDSVLVAEMGGKGDEQARLHCLERKSGNLQWSRPIFASGVLAVTPRQVLIQDKENHLTSLDKQGKPQWSTPVGSLATNRSSQQAAYLYPMAASNIILVATSESAGEVGLERKPALLALDQASGKLIWRTPLDGIPHTSPFVVKTTIYLGTTKGLEARSLIDGKLLDHWNCQAGPPSAEFAVGENTIAYVNQAGEVIVIHREDGSVKGRVGGVLPGFPPLPSRDVFLVVTQNGLSQAAFSKGDDGKPQLKLEAWAETSTLGPLAAPIVTSGLRLFIPSVDRGLICIGSKQ